MALALFQFFNALIDLYLWIIILNAVVSWLINFNVINMSNRLVYSIVDMSHRVTEPALRPIRQVLPPMGGLDLSPIILYLAVQYLVRQLLVEIFRALV
jgi:YggT family protein